MDNYVIQWILIVCNVGSKLCAVLKAVRILRFFDNGGRFFAFTLYHDGRFFTFTFYDGSQFFTFDDGGRFSTFTLYHGGRFSMFTLYHGGRFFTFKLYHVGPAGFSKTVRVRDVLPKRDSPARPETERATFPTYASVNLV
jgi:hypothetical protein